nr:reverse transcriptase domain-containing protein [Tanacetum cinerariifolium]
QGTEVTKDQVQTSNPQSTAPVQPTVTQSEPETPVSEPVVAPVSASMPNLKPSISYPSRRDTERRHDQANEQIEKFYEIFKEMSFEISFTDALMLMPKFASTLKALIGNKEKLSEMARTPMNEHCSVVILNKLPKKHGDPEKFLIPCEFPGMDECLALADLSASINLMPLFVWKGISLPELTLTCMTLELADRTESKPVGIAKDVKVKVDFEPDPRVSLILGRCFLKTSRALIDVHKGELTLRIGNEAITYNLDQTSRYSANYDQMTANKIDVTDEACEEYSQEVLGFSDVTASGSPTPSNDLIVSTTSPSLTPFGDSDFLLFEEADAFLGLEDDPDSPELDPSYYDPEGDILSLEVILNRMDECLALADLGVSINLMPLSVWKGLSLPELTPTCMTLELADRTKSKPVGIAKDVKVKVGVFHFPTDFVVVDFKPDPRVPLILRRCFLKTSRALIDVHKGELTLRIENEAITYNLDQTSRYSANYDQMTANKIDVTDEACEEYSQKVLGFFDVTASGSPTPSDDPFVSTTSPTLTPFGDSDFLLFEEADAFLGLKDDPDSLELDPSYYDPEGDILTLRIGNEAITYNLDQTVRYSANYNQMTANKIDIIESACEEYSQEVPGFSNVIASGTPTPHNDPIIFATSPTLTLFEDSDFLLFEEADAFLGLEDDPDSP